MCMSMFKCTYTYTPIHIHMCMGVHIHPYTRTRMRAHRRRERERERERDAILSIILSYESHVQGDVANIVSNIGLEGAVSSMTS